MVGNFATSRAGHDKGKCYVIIGEEGDFVYLCDGRLKTLAAPKRKRKKHVQMTKRTVGRELLSKLTGGGELPDSPAGREVVRDEEIKYEIKQYLKQV